MTAGPDRIESLLLRMDGLLAGFESSADPRRYFLATYRRTTVAVQAEIARGGFADGAWVERWDLIFAGLYLDAAEQWSAEHTAPGPWAVAFDSGLGAPLPPLRHVLLGMNAHINYDLPQSLLAAITDAEFDDPAVVARRAADHARILSAARRQSAEALAGRITQLGDLSSARVTDLRAPGQVLIKLAVRGFGVTLPPGPAG